MLSLLTNSISFGQDIHVDEYDIYTALIKSEITSKSKSVTIISSLKKDSSSVSWVTEKIESGEKFQLADVAFITADDRGNRLDSIDTATQNLILNFGHAQFKDSILTNSFNLKPKVFLVNMSPFKEYSKSEWDNFYRLYHGSGGLFQFSNIYYSGDHKAAVFYYSIRKNSLSSHGRIVIMKKDNGTWKIKYSVNIWQS